MDRSVKPWVLITGAAGGIGQALVHTFSEAGYRILATDQYDRSACTDGEYLPIDLDRYAGDEQYAGEFNANVALVVQEKGLRALINNAATQQLAPTERVSRQSWEATLRTNLSAPFFLTQALLPQLESAGGAVVNISSIHATQTKPEFVAYATSKAALSALTRNLAVDLGDKVRINAIEPAAVETAMLVEGFEGKPGMLEQLREFHPLQRLATPQEIAQLALFLCSDEASFLHGTCISASGGIHGCLSDPGS